MGVVVKVYIYGRVQGVGYRAWTVGRARKLGLNGWVRNRTDGTVEVVIAGPEEAVRALIEECHKGPLVARVDKVTHTPFSEAVKPGFVALPTL